MPQRTRGLDHRRGLPYRGVGAVERADQERGARGRVGGMVAEALAPEGGGVAVGDAGRQGAERAEEGVGGEEKAGEDQCRYSDVSTNCMPGWDRTSSRRIGV